MSLSFMNSEWYKLRMKLLGKDTEENYIHHYRDQDEEYVELCENGGDYSTVRMQTFNALKKRGLLRQITHISRVQPDADSYRFTVK